jgi:hypothetical protein
LEDSFGLKKDRIELVQFGESKIPQGCFKEPAVLRGAAHEEIDVSRVSGSGVKRKGPAPNDHEFNAVSVQ